MPTRKRASINFAIVSVCLVLAACEPRPVELGFWLEPVSFVSPRLGGPITASELAGVDATAREEIARAFSSYDVRLTDNRRAHFRVIVMPTLTSSMFRRRTGYHAGESRAAAGFGGSGAVNFEYIANGTMVFAPDDATRADMMAALGRGIGRVAIHEFLHQLLPKAPLHDSRDRETYEGNSPAVIEGYYGDLRWGVAAPWLEARLKRR